MNANSYNARLIQILDYMVLWSGSTSNSYTGPDTMEVGKMTD